MWSSIENVKNNINAIVDQLKADHVDVRLGLVGFKDITCDGLYSTKDYGWFTNVDDFKTAVDNLYADGGGDWEESDVDGLEISREKDFRNSVNKYIILLTDAPYKNGTRYNPDMTMDSEISLLKNDNISVSVVTDNSVKNVYEPLYTQTNGIVADIYGVFVTVLQPLIERMTTISNKGAWIRLSNGSIVHLDKDPSLDDYTVDTDKDGIPDLEELNQEVQDSYSDAGSDTTWNYKSWTFKTNPASIDTDGDGISDKFDKNPTNFDIRIKDKTDDYILLNNGKKWTIFGIDIYSFMDELYYGVDWKLDEPPVVPFDQVGTYYSKLCNNDKLNLSPEELSVIYLKDTNGVRYYLDSRSEDLRNKTFKFITGSDVKYYKHTLSGWKETKETKSKWYDIFSPIYSQADISLVICRKQDAIDFIKNTLPKLVCAGVVMYGGFLAADVLDVTLNYAAQFGFANTLEMLRYGGITGMNAVMETCNYWQRAQQILADGEVLETDSPEWTNICDYYEGVVNNIRDEYYGVNYLGKNVSYTETLINDVKYEIKGCSTSTNVEGFAELLGDQNLPEVPERFFTTEFVDSKNTVYETYEPGINWNRCVDCEARTLEKIARQLGAVRDAEGNIDWGDVDATGTINLYTENEPCPSCQNVINQFTKIYKNIKINVFWSK